MHNLGLLIKNSFNILLGKIKGKKNRSTKSAVYLLLLGALAIYAVYFFQSYTMIDSFHQYNVEKIALFHCCLTAFSVILILGMMRSTTMEKSRDADMLLSLPIKKVDIILSKTLSYYLFDFAFTFVLLTPYIICYQIVVSFNAVLLINGIVLTFLLPLLSVGVSLIFSFVFSRIFNKFKSANLLKSIVLILLFTLVIILMIFKQMSYNPEGITDVNKFCEDRFFANLLLTFIYSPNLLNVVYVLLITILPFVLGAILFVINFGKSFLKYHSKKQTLKFGSNKNSLGLLIKKELYFFVETPGYIINTIIGPILALTLSLYLCFNGANELNSMLGGVLSTNNLPFILSIAFCGLVATANISACSISLEGKNFWILKSSPIKENELFISKVLNHIIIVVPFMILSSVILSIACSFSLLQFLTILTPCILLTCIQAFSGVFINLFLPNFNWDDPTKVVKNGLSTLLSMVLSFVLALFPLALLLIFNLEQNLILLLTLALYTLVLTVFATLLISIGKKIFNKI